VAQRGVREQLRRRRDEDVMFVFAMMIGAAITSYCDARTRLL
jgi:hypothetical protein